MRLAPLAVILALAGCVVVPAHRPPPPPPPPRAAPGAPLTEQQAVDLAAEHARSRGLDVRRTTRAFLDAKGRWHVDLVGPESRADLVIDAASGRILRSRLRLGPPPPPAPPRPVPPGSPPGSPAGSLPGSAGPQEPREPPPPARDDDWDE
jgi:hypothetical protein